MIDEISKSSYENVIQSNNLGIEGEESHKWLDINEANHFLAEDFQRSFDCLF